MIRVHANDTSVIVIFGRSGGSSGRMAWLRRPRLDVDYQLGARHGTDSDVGSASGPPLIAASMYGLLKVQVTHWLTNQRYRSKSSGRHILRGRVTLHCIGMDEKHHHEVARLLLQ